MHSRRAPCFFYFILFIAFRANPLSQSAGEWSQSAKDEASLPADEYNPPLYEGNPQCPYVYPCNRETSTSRCPGDFWSKGVLLILVSNFYFLLSMIFLGFCFFFFKGVCPLASLSWNSGNAASPLLPHPLPRHQLKK